MKIKTNEEFKKANVNHDVTNEPQDIDEATKILQELISKCSEMEKRLSQILKD